MRPFLRIPAPTTILRRNISHSAPRLSSFSPGPSPPRLPKEDQDLFEKLQRQSHGAFSIPSSTPTITTSSTSSTSTITTTSVSASTTATQTSSASAQSVRQQDEPVLRAEVKKNEELHPAVRRGAPPEFEGEVNPRTGEVGGPKNEPLRWGHGGDWSYNGRVTDF